MKNSFAEKMGRKGHLVCCVCIKVGHWLRVGPCYLRDHVTMRQLSGGDRHAQGTLNIKDQKLEMRVRVAGSSEAAGKTKDMKQLSGLPRLHTAPEAELVHGVCLRSVCSLASSVVNGACRRRALLQHGGAVAGHWRVCGQPFQGYGRVSRVPAVHATCCT